MKTYAVVQNGRVVQMYGADTHREAMDYAFDIDGFTVVGMKPNGTKYFDFDVEADFIMKVL